MKKLLIGVLAVALVVAFSVSAWAWPCPGPHDETQIVKARLGLSSGLLNLTISGGNTNPYWVLPDPINRGRYFTQNNVIELRMDSSIKWELYTKHTLSGMPPGAIGTSGADAVADFRAAFEMRGAKSKNGGLFNLDLGAGWHCYKSPDGKFASRSSANHANDMRTLVSYRWDTDDIGVNMVPPTGTYTYTITFLITAV